MVKIGMMIGDRYEILEKIGTGGMSDVYKAKCHKLNRFVAVKVLKQEFSENANFVSKFRIEAQAAAGLMHPNIVNVYDVGEENGIYYIVMELVEGITLKKYIEKKARLSYKEAVSIAIQISMGIEAAHKNHIIHRDIKPQNIIISKEGKVKVTDFGIAKAATSNTITSNVMGSVHYTSPEQARGGFSDEKSDIYSLGITLFEMLTGRVPFNGETTVAIAIKQIQEELPRISDFVADVPTSVEGIVVKCCQKSPDRRYQAVEGLIRDLKQSLVNPDADFVVLQKMDTTGGTRVISNEDIKQIKRQSTYQTSRDYETTEETMRLRSEVEEYNEEDEDEDGEGNNPRLERITTWIAIIMGVFICLVIVFMATRIFKDWGTSPLPSESTSPIHNDISSTSDVAYTRMPQVNGINVEDAKRALIAVKLVPETEYIEHDTIDEGIVIRANVEIDTELAQGSKVLLTVSAGAESAIVPELLKESYDTAENRLRSVKLQINKVDDYSDTVEEGCVISQTPESGTKVPSGSVVTVKVSKGKQAETVRVPRLIGRTEQDGTIVAIEAGVQIGSVTQVYSNEVEADLICYQSYSQGAFVAPGTKIDIKVSMGPDSTYKYNASITAPTPQEAPGYVNGSEVGLKLVADNGLVLMDTNVTSFPQAANFYGIPSKGGTMTMSYTVTLPGTSAIDPVTGTEIITPGSSEVRSFTRRIEFTKE